MYVPNLEYDCSFPFICLVDIVLKFTLDFYKYFFRSTVLYIFSKILLQKERKYSVGNKNFFCGIRIDSTMDKVKNEGKDKPKIQKTLNRKLKSK